MSRIAYITPSGQIATVAPDGSAARILTALGTAYQFPAWSPDGSRIAAIGSDARGAGVFVIADGLGMPPVQSCYQSRDEPPIYLSWSPSGAEVGFIAFHPDGLRLLVGPVGQAPRVLAQGQPCFWSWSPDGQQLLVHLGARVGDPDLAFYAADGSGRGPRLGDPGLFQTPVIAASGRCWAYAEVDEQGETRLVIERAGDLPPVHMRHEGVVALSWSPVSDQLAFICPAVPAQQFYGPLQLLTIGSPFVRLLADAPVLAFFWAPDGQQIAYLTPAGNPGRVSPSLNGNGSYKTGRLQPARAQGHPRTGAGLDVWVVDLPDGIPRRLIQIDPPAQFISQFLPFFDQYALSHRFWSPDSSALVLPSIASGRAEIVVVPVSGGQPLAIAEGLMACWNSVESTTQS